MAVPASTYRLQITDRFTLNDAAAQVGYLADLGAGAVYLSPILQSAAGSQHGYDTTDPSRIDAARGGQAGLDQLLAACREAGLGVVIDIVPNHLGVADAAENPAWWDVLTYGQDSAYADWFDIDWSRGPIVLPVLGDDAELSVVDGELRYFEHRFPLAPGSWSAGEDADRVHARQHYRLVHWSLGNTELSYRRFFAVATLAGLRVEDERVFEATHARVRDWVAAGVAGLRIDHPDGLVDPAEYLQRLRALAPDQWITVEKILEPGEQLPEWPVAGTTGYDAMREVNGVFVDPAAEAAMTETYQRLTGDLLTSAEHVTAGKRMVLAELLVAEQRRMAALIPEIALPTAVELIAEIATAFEVYRSYLPEGAERLDAALAMAVERRPDLTGEFELISGRLHDPDDELARRMQQLTGATMAKGTEDTAFYRYARFVALNEVGGDPAEFGIAPAEFHRLQLARQLAQPDSMTSLSTHDTKRGEDVRARLAVLAELPDRWSRFAERFLDATGLPDRAYAYFLAQTLVGTGIVERERLHAYAEKSMREASVETTWTAPDAAYEALVHAAVDLAYDDPALHAEWAALDAELTPYGWVNSLGQKLVQLTMPGVPDVYQGTELWDDSLVDPDNRRPVDFAARRTLLAGLAGAPPVDASGAAKLWVTAQALRARRDRRADFTSYAPVTATGPAADHALAFDRGGAITVATRLPVGLATAGGWRDTTLTLSAAARDLLTDREWSGTVLLADLLSELPVALLVAEHS